MLHVETYTQERGSNMDRWEYDASAAVEIVEELERDMDGHSWDYAVAWSDDGTYTATIARDRSIVECCGASSMGELHGLAADAHGDIVDLLRDVRRAIEAVLGPALTGEETLSADDAENAVETLREVNAYMSDAIAEIVETAKFASWYRGAVACIRGGIRR